MTTSPDVPLRTAYLTAAFCGVVAAVYVIAEVQPSPIVYLFVSFAPAIAVVVWLDRDARRTGVAAVLDWGFFLWLAWPFVLPWYVFRTRGIPGWRLLVGLVGLIGAPFLTGFVAGWFSYGVRLALWYWNGGGA